MHASPPPNGHPRPREGPPAPGPGGAHAPQGGPAAGSVYPLASWSSRAAARCVDAVVIAPSVLRGMAAWNRPNRQGLHDKIAGTVVLDVRSE